MNVKNKNHLIYKRIICYLKPFKPDIAILIVCMIISSGMNLIMPLIGQRIMDLGLIPKKLSIIIEYSLLIFLLVILDRIISLLETKHFINISTKFQYNLFRIAFRRLLYFKQEYFNKVNYSEIISNVNTDVSNVSKIADQESFTIVSLIFRMIIGIVGLLLISWKLTILIGIIVPIKYLFMKVLSSQRKRTIEEFLKQNQDFYSWFGELLNGIKEIKLWCTQYLAIGTFVKKQRKIIKTNIKLAYLDNINNSGDALLFQLVTCLIYIVGGIFLTQHSITIGGLYALLSYSAYVTAPIAAIINLKYNYACVMPSAKRLFEFIDNETENECDNKSKIVNIQKSQIKGNIRFENITFGYLKNNPILLDVNFEIKQGEKVAIMGENGSGKTTILNLLLRFYKPDSGVIYLDEKDITTIKLKDYRELFSVVCQDPYIFNDSIKRNVNLRNDRTDKEIAEACKKSRADQFIEILPDQYNSNAGRNGSAFSGGERQKIAVARAFINDSPIIVFDEATSNFDSFSDEYLNNIIFTELKDKTVIVISHKQSITKYMDKVFAVEEGHIAELSMDRSAVRSDDINVIIGT